MKLGSPELRSRVSEIIKAKWQDPTYREHMRQAHRGHKHTEEHKANISNAGKGHVVTEITRIKISHANTGKVRTEEAKAKISASKKLNPIRFWLGKHRPETMAKVADKIRGRKQSEAHKLAISMSHRGDKAYQWAGGSKRGKHSLTGHEYRFWRKSVFVRDNFTCQICEAKSGKLNAHHIKPWSSFPDVRYSVENGMTLCNECHNIIHITYRLADKNIFSLFGEE